MTPTAQNIPMLWAVFMAIQIFVGGLWGVAISVVIVLHCAFYMVNIHRWNCRLIRVSTLIPASSGVITSSSRRLTAFYSSGGC